MTSPDYSLRVISEAVNPDYSFATHGTIEQLLRFLSTETESHIPTHEVTMIPNDTFPPDHKAAGKIEALAQAAKAKSAAVIAGANDVTQDIIAKAGSHAQKAVEKTAAVIEGASQVAKDVAVKTGEQVEKLGDKVAEAGQKILKLV